MSRLTASVVVWLVLASPATIGLIGTPASQAGDSVVPPANLKIAFFGDQGLGDDAVAVLNLVKSERAHAVVHLGDFDYRNQPAAWEAQINGVLGENFPYFATIGNHDERQWDGPNGYQQYLMNRLRRLGITWDGDLGVQSSVRYQGIFLVLTAPGVRDTAKLGHDAYIRERLAADHSIWSVSAWHRNMERMQVGGKDNDTGWGVYDESANAGAIIVSGHEHSYSRTHLLSSISKQTVVSTANVLTLTKGQSFVVVTGLGGKGIRPQRLSGDWWARINASKCLRNDQACHAGTFGALFGVFNVDGTPNKAEFYFKDIKGRVIDRFTVMSRVEPVATTTQQ